MSELILFLVSYSEHIIYAGLFLILFFCGLGLPLPEEVTLLAGGFLINLGILHFYPTMATVFAGVLAGDLAMYSIGRKWGQGIITHRHMRRIFSEGRLEKVKQFFCDHGSKTIFIARFIMGFRMATFLAAGMMGVRPSQFLFLDFLAALIMIPLLVLLGFFFGTNVEWLGEIFTRIDLLLKLLAVLGALAALGYLILRKIKFIDHQDL